MKLARIVALVIGVGVIGVALIGPIFEPHSPTSGEIADRLAAPGECGRTTGACYLLGADDLGRDILSRLMGAFRTTVLITCSTVAIAGLLGSALGLLAAAKGGVLDYLVLRSSDILLATPIILVGVVLAATVGPGIPQLIALMAVLTTPWYARQVRGEAKAVLGSQFVRYARVVGSPWTRIVRTHLLPMVRPSIIVLATTQLAYVAILEASLSFLGVGVRAPTPTLGGMVSEGQEYLAGAWWVSVLPMACLAAFVFAVMVAGDWLSDSYVQGQVGRRRLEARA